MVRFHQWIPESVLTFSKLPRLLAGNLTRTWRGKSEMPRYITILGTSHDLQGAEKRKSSVNDPTFSEAIEFLLSGKDFVFEEASGCGPTIVEKSAHEKLGPGHYLDVDPSRADRERYGIGDTGGQPIPIDFLHPVDGYLCPEYDLEQEKRENLWLYQIEGKNFARALFICGYLHTFSMAFRLRHAGYELETWYYMSHEKLCRKQHKS